jgi:hypothetical protein
VSEGCLTLLLEWLTNFAGRLIWCVEKFGRRLRPALCPCLRLFRFYLSALHWDTAFGNCCRAVIGSNIIRDIRKDDFFRTETLLRVLDRQMMQKLGPSLFSNAAKDVSTGDSER